MSTQKDKIDSPQQAKRSFSSVLAEVLLCKKLGWDLEFISAGYGALEFEELLTCLKAIKKIWGKKIWLNIGYLTEEQIKKLKLLTEGVSLSIETVNWELRKKLCPSKHLEPMIKTLGLCDKYKLKKSITLVLGLGETILDFEELKNFIQEYKLDRITFYRLKPHKGTIFEKKEPLKTEDYLEWIKKTKKAFPKIKIIVGSWLTHLDELHLLLQEGAEEFTKFPIINIFATKHAKKIEEECRKANRKLLSRLTVLPKINWEKEIKKYKLGDEVLDKLLEYIKTMEKNINNPNSEEL